MNIGSSMKGLVAPSWHSAQRKTVNLRTLIDPADLMGGQAASEERKEAGRAQKRAMQDAVRLQEEMYRKGLEYMAPYREYGMQALPALTRSLQPGSELGTMRSKLGQQYLPQALGGIGFGQDVINELMGKYRASVGAQEETARVNRAQDIMGLGMGSAAQGAGMAGRQGRSMADLYLQGAQQKGQLATEQALARRQGGMGVAYGGYRSLMDYLGG